MKLSVKIWKEGKWYIGRIPELRVTTQGRTLNSVKRNLREAASLQLETMVDYIIKHRNVKLERGQLIKVKQ